MCRAHNLAVLACGPMDAERLLLDHLALLDRIVANTCRRHRTGIDDMEEFAATIRLKLVANDYEVLRAWQERCSLSTYLVAVVNNAFLDFRNHLWGKWRPSAKARRLGTLAIQLETLLHRDGLSLAEALAKIAPSERSDAERLIGQLPVRLRRHVEGEEALDNLAAAGPDPEEDLLAHEQAQTLERLSQALRDALSGLPAEDRLLVKMRLEDGFTVAEVARALHCEAKPLYRRYERILVEMRSTLEGGGWSADSVSEILGSPEAQEARPRSSDRALRGANP